MSERRLWGVSASSGIAIGHVVRLRQGSVGIANRLPNSPLEERARFEAALEVANRELEELSGRAGPEGEAILRAQQLMLQDPELRAQVEGAVVSGLSADQAVVDFIEVFASTLAALDDPYLRERAADVRDVGRRLLGALHGKWVGLVLTQPAILVADDLAPSQTLSLDRSLLLGIVTEQGGPTSHTAILARAWGIPAVVAATGVLNEVTDGMLIAIDGAAGEVLLHPSEGSLADLQSKRAEAEVEVAQQRAGRELPGESLDGHRVELAANIGSPSEVAEAVAQGAEGIGLLRSEFLFMGRKAPPDEEEQYQSYTAALQAAGDRRVIIRTLDIGGDKALPYLSMPKEENPFLGVRALRLCRRHPELFRQQLRALLRASSHGRLGIMFPMVGSLEEWRWAKQALVEAQESLLAEGRLLAGGCEVGIMIEIPAAALIAGHLAPEVDFFSIGTNDLVQYTLAVDRGNPGLAPMYQPYHPAVLQLVQQVVRAAHAAGKWVGVCGEMAGQPEGALLLFGLGVDELSMSAGLLPGIRRLIRGSRYEEARAVAAEAVGMGSAEEVLSRLRGRP